MPRIRAPADDLHAPPAAPPQNQLVSDIWKLALLGGVADRVRVAEPTRSLPSLGVVAAIGLVARGNDQVRAETLASRGGCWDPVTLAPWAAEGLIVYLGKIGVSVSNLCLGAMMFGEWGTKDHDESIRIIHRALHAGINFIDTADIYSTGESEEIVGKALAGGRRENVVLASKAHMPMGDDPNQRGNSRRWIVTEVENSLRRLQTDWIDLYQIHRPDPNTDIDETLGALTDLVHQGKIRYFGHSTFPVSEIVEAQWTAERRGRERFRCEQPPYSILTRAVEHDVLPTCQRYGMGVIPTARSPAAGYQAATARRRHTGAMSPARQRLANRFDMSLPENQRKLDAADALAKVANDAGITLVEMAIAFVIRHPAVTAAIIGPRTMEHLESQLTAADVTLTDDVLDRIDEIVAPGTTINVADNGWTQPSISDPAIRRR